MFETNTIARILGAFSMKDLNISLKESTYTLV
nr:MAG TPA: hypothetical protein [Bacteriophage sp.]